MKHKPFALLLCLLVICSVQLNAQETAGFPFTGWAYGDDGMPCENSTVQLVVRFIDVIEDKEVYKESFSTMSNDRGQFTANVSKGFVEGGEFETDYLTKPRYKMVIDMVVDCDGQEVVVVDRDVAAPRVPVAEDAAHWGGMPAPGLYSDTTGWKDFLAGPYAWTLPVFNTDSMGNDSTKLVTPSDLKAEITQKDLCGFSLLEPMTPEEIQNKVDNSSGEKEIILDLLGNTYIVGDNSLIPVTYFEGRLQQKYEWSTRPATQPGGFEWTVLTPVAPIEDPHTVFGNVGKEDTVRSKYNMNVPDIGMLGHGLEVSIHHENPPSQNTAAIWGNNPAGTTGIFGVGGAFGNFGQGATGSFGVTLNNDKSGTGLWGTIGQQPGKSNFAYGVLADANNIPSSFQAWALAVFGDGFVTGTLSQMSDSRLKHSVRTPDFALSKVMALQPKQYRYDQDTPFNLPDGEHFGFLAQEMEEVLPELVSNVRVPSTLDPNSIATAESEEYKAINYIALIPILTKAIQELNTKVDLQSAEIERLGKVIEDLNRD